MNKRILKVKGLSRCLLLLMMWLVSGNLYAQSDKITIDVKNEKIKEVINKIENSSSYKFFYNDGFDVSKLVSVKADNADIEFVMSKILKDSEYEYSIKNNYIIIRAKYKSGQKFTISGIVKDKETGEKLIGANVFETKSLKGAASNVYGFYSLTIPAGNVEIAYSFVGMKTETKSFRLTGDTIIDIEMISANTLKEVVVSANSSLREVQSPQMSNTKIQIDKIKNLPAFLGEADVIKTIQLLPGVQSGTEGSSGLYVRGGGPDQNLILLDGVPVYNANHLFGFFSVFNPDAVKNVELFKGGFPARFGGRLSSVVDIRMKEGNEKELKGTFSIGLISSKLNLEGPIIKDRTAFNISLRRTYVDMVARPFMKKKDRGNTYYFYDLNAKVNHKFSDKSRLYLSFYTGLDKAGGSSSDNWGSDGDEYKSEDKTALKWGNITTALRWNYIITNKLFSNTTVTYSRYNFNVEAEDREFHREKKTTDFVKFDYESGIYDFTYKVDFDYYRSSDWLIRFGANYTNHTFKPGVNTSEINDAGEEVITKRYGGSNIKANEFSGYIENEFKLFNRLNMNVGLHYSAFNVKNSFYHSFEPRANLSYMLTERLSFKAAYSKMKQYIHLLSNSTLSFPTDLWVPVTDKIKPMTSEQVAAGFAYNITDGLNVSIEAFYKDMNGLIEYKEGAGFWGNSVGWEDKVEAGKGKAYGLEFFINKTIGKTSGWIGYTLSKTDRKFENISFGKTFPAKYDRRHDISFVMTHKFSKKFDIGLNWVYGTGNAFTLPTHRIAQDFPFTTHYGTDYPISHFDSRNNYRAPAYHRMDLGFNFHKKKKHGVRTWNISVYNVYNRSNPFYLYLSHDENNGNHKQKLKQVSIFSIIPSVSYIYKF